MRTLENIINALEPDRLADLNAHLLTFVNPDRAGRIDRVLAQRMRFVAVVLENVYQSQNASAVIRSCECFGIQDLHAIEVSNPFRPHRSVVQGAGKWVTLHRHRGRNATFNCLDGLRHTGYRVVAMTPEPDGLSLDELPLDDPVALCFGAEEPGPTEQARTMADETVAVSMQGFTRSLNLSVTAGLALHRLGARVRGARADWHLDPARRDRLRALWLARSIKAGGRIARRRLESYRG